MSELRYVIDICGLEEEIRCAICENPMHTDKGCDGNCKYNEKAFKRITDLLDKRIELLPITPEPHWIPVTKQPPEVGKSVLICDTYGDICLGHRTSSGYYFPDFCEDKIKDVRAWMPLPEPYKGVTE